MTDVPGYEGIYALTDDFRVWSYPKLIRSNYYSKGRFLTPSYRDDDLDPTFNLRRKSVRLSLIKFITYNIITEVKSDAPDECIFDIPGYEGRYSITKSGRIWSHAHMCAGKMKGRGLIKGKWLKPSVAYHGYANVILSHRKSWRVHRLMALTFLPKIDGKCYVNHKNMIRNDNRIENLEWVSFSENMKHGLNNNLKRKIPIRPKKLSEESRYSLFLKYLSGKSIELLMAEFRVGSGMCYQIIRDYSNREVRAQKNVTLGRTQEKYHSIVRKFSQEEMDQQLSKVGKVMEDMIAHKIRVEEDGLPTEEEYLKSIAPGTWVPIKDTDKIPKD